MGDVCKNAANRSSHPDSAVQTGVSSSINDTAFLLADIADQLNDPIITTDLCFNITYVNGAFCEVYGYSSDEVLGKSAVIFNAAANAEEIQNDIYQTVSGGKVWKGEVLNRRKDGSTFPCELVISPLKDGNGNIAAYSGLHRDITSLKSSEEQFIQKIQMKDRLLEKIPCIAMVLERGSRRIIASNEAARKIGADVGEFCYDKCSLRSDPCPWCVADEIWDNDESRQMEIKYQGTDYEGYWAPLTENLYVHYIFDITERKAAEETLKRQSLRKDILLKLNKMRDSTKEEILAFVRREITRITESEFGFIGFLSSDESSMKIESWSGKVMDKCAIDYKPTVFPLSPAGRWAESIRQRKPVVYNDFAIDPSLNPVLPEGHVPIERLISIPVFDGDRIVMVAALANKKSPYDESDISVMTSMMEDVWRLLRQKESEAALRLSEEKFSKIFHSSPDSVTLTGIDSGIFLEVNKGFEEMSGYSRDEVIGKSTLEVNLWLNPGDREAMIKEFLSEGSLKDYEMQVVNRKGEICDCLICCELIEIDSEPCLLSITRDITEHKRAENTMDKQRYYLEKAQEIGLIGTWELDLLEDVLNWTEENYLIFGVPLGTVMNYEKFLECVHPDDRECVDSKWKGCVYGEPYDIEHRIVSNGKVKWVREKAELFFDEHGKIVRAIGVTQDITKRKHVLEQLEIAKENAEAANAAKSEFLANMSHEIRTPISVITGFSDMLASEELTDQQGAYVELIRNAGKSLLVIINDILDYSKIEAGKLDIILSEHSLEDIIEVVDRMMRPQAVKKGLRFELIRGRGLPEIIKTDQVRVHECLTNLVSNAIKFTDSGFVFLKVGIENHDGELFIRFDVEDSGIGIPSDDQKNIFDSFSQVEKGRTRYFGGAGLGLAITGRLAGLLGGSVSLASEKGEGSTFTLLIPAGVKAGTDIDTLRKSKRRIVEIKKQTPKFSSNVLVAEDHEGCRLIIRRMLERYGLNITTVDDGKKAVDSVLSGSFDLVFMDIRMPEYNGIEATEILRQNGVTIPIIALTAHAMEGDRQMCIDAGFSDYLSKPVEGEKLLDILSRYAGRDVKKV